IVAGFWQFEDLKPGPYKLRLRYVNSDREFQPSFGVEAALEPVWTGDVTTPFVEFALVEPAAAADDFGEEVKGLRAKITLAANKFLIGDPIQMEYAVKNVSGWEQVIWHSGFWANHQILVTDADGKEAPLTWMGQKRRESFSPGGERSKNAPFAIPAGGQD